MTPAGAGGGDAHGEDPFRAIPRIGELPGFVIPGRNRPRSQMRTAAIDPALNMRPGPGFAICGDNVIRPQPLLEGMGIRVVIRPTMGCLDGLMKGLQGRLPIFRSQQTVS